MNFEEQKRRVAEQYQRYEDAVAPLKGQAACERGCATCCTAVGNVVATTLEALILREYLATWSEEELAELAELNDEHLRTKSSSDLARCPFLDDDDACRVYSVRPFACRRLYSVQRCDGGSPLIHRQAVVLGQRVGTELEALDLGGCSGHIAYLVDLLDREEVLEAYFEGRCRWGDVAREAARFDVVPHRRVGRKRSRRGRRKG